MSIKKETISQWLKETNRDRAWLAEKCSVSPRTVNNWLTSPIKVPAKAIVIIQQLMASDQADTHTPTAQNLVLEFTDSEFTAIENKALAEGKTVRTWATDTLNDAARLDSLITRLQKHPEQIHRLIAEDPPPYGQT